MADERTVLGLAELAKFLSSLAPKLEKSIMRGAMRAGGVVIMRSAESKVHSITGGLVRGFTVGTSARRGVVKARVRVKGPKNKPNLPIWVEYGTRPHLISVSDQDRRVSDGGGGTTLVSMTTINRWERIKRALMIGNRFVGPVVKHPGARPHPFLRPSLDQAAGAAVVAAGEYIKKRLTKEGLEAAGEVDVVEVTV